MTTQKADKPSKKLKEREMKGLRDILRSDVMLGICISNPIKVANFVKLWVEVG